MHGLSRITYTDLFWETLGELRGTPYYRQACEGIRACAVNKLTNRNFRSATDEPFTAQKELKGFWHARILGSPLRLLFYSIEGDTLQIGCVGDHSDYGWKGKHSGAAERLVNRIRNSVKKGHVPFPDWEPPRWSNPDQLLDHPDLALLGRSALVKLDGQLNGEWDDLAVFKRKHGDDAVNDVDLAMDWLERVAKVRDRLGFIIASRPILERTFKDATPSEAAMVNPSAEAIAGYAAFR
ncbi:hypothetical protein OIU34_21265 [Pararhizobium sp. BT-229]|uniref:hypothetical protein n=1 Tax=Pararhizobium sp. BT-229 TaxID=2986923 RepID=UPI0021F7A0E8|nr:hypothetical protein [Pararhizobium sp. BT-229]MCV9964422.1 hypothetical protein [Pararhizobium sp. BT-229]